MQLLANVHLDKKYSSNVLMAAVLLTTPSDEASFLILPSPIGWLLACHWYFLGETALYLTLITLFPDDRSQHIEFGS